MVNINNVHYEVEWNSLKICSGISSFLGSNVSYHGTVRQLNITLFFSYILFLKLYTSNEISEFEIKLLS